MPKHIEENKVFAVNKVTEALRSTGDWDRVLEGGSDDEVKSVVEEFCAEHADEIIWP